MRTEATGPLRRRPAPLEVKVERVEELSGGFVRVTFTGDALDDFSWPGAASHLKFFPSPPDTPTGDGALVVPARPASRTYTPRTFDSARGELALDFLIHGEGLGSSWAASATAGDAVRVSVREPRTPLRHRPSGSCSPETTRRYRHSRRSSTPA